MLSDRVILLVPKASLWDECPMGELVCSLVWLESRLGALRAEAGRKLLCELSLKEMSELSTCKYPNAVCFLSQRRVQVGRQAERMRPSSGLCRCFS